MRPTDEQQAILDVFRTGEDICIEAGAGCGKTSTLVMIGRSDLDLHGVCIAFNASIAAELRTKLPGTVSCQTSHALALRTQRERFGHRLDEAAMKARDLSDFLGIRKFFRVGHGRRDVSNWKVASLAKQTVIRYCQSGDDEINGRHVPFVIGLPKERRRDLVEHVLPYARRIWREVVSVDIEGRSDGGVYLGRAWQDCQLKVWALGDPTINCDFLCLDEAQDTNGVLAGVIERQRERDTQVIVVGDSSQQLYAWRGAEDFLTKFEAPHRMPLTLSFRFGEAIADEANQWLRYLDAPIRLRGLDSIASTSGRVELPRAVLCRTNADVVDQVFAAQNAGVPTAIIGGANSITSFAEGVEQLQREGKSSHYELSSFKSWVDVVAYVQEEQPDGSFGTFVRLIERYGVGKVLKIAAGCVNERSAERVVGTVHSVKGLEWPSVLVDAGLIPEEGEPDRSGMMICYVGVTRAQYALDATAFSGLHDRRSAVRQARMRRAMLASA